MRHAGANNALANEQTVASGGPGRPCVGGAAYCYMNEAPLFMGGLGGPTTVTVTCTPSGPPGVNPTWTVQVQVASSPPSASSRTSTGGYSARHGPLPRDVGRHALTFTAGVSSAEPVTEHDGRARVDAGDLGARGCGRHS